jgi:hypothetical protein
MLWYPSHPDNKQSTEVDINVIGFIAQVHRNVVTDSELDLKDYVIVSQVTFNHIQHMYISLDLQELIRGEIEFMFNLWWNGEKQRFDTKYGDRLSDFIFNHNEEEETITGSLSLKMNVFIIPPPHNE